LPFQKHVLTQLLQSETEVAAVVIFEHVLSVQVVIPVMKVHFSFVTLLVKASQVVFLSALPPGVYVLQAPRFTQPVPFQAQEPAK
jgi:hypothetical protein